MGYFLIQSKFSKSHFVFSWSVEVFSMFVIHACTAHLDAHPEFLCSSWKKFSNCNSWWFRPNLRDLGKNSIVERWKILVSATISKLVFTIEALFIGAFILHNTIRHFLSVTKTNNRCFWYFQSNSRHDKFTNGTIIQCGETRRRELWKICRLKHANEYQEGFIVPAKKKIFTKFEMAKDSWNGTTT